MVEFVKCFSYEFVGDNKWRRNEMDNGSELFVWKDLDKNFLW